MLVGKCPKCNTRYTGEGLDSPWHPICAWCGVELQITNSCGKTPSSPSRTTALVELRNKLQELSSHN